MTPNEYRSKHKRCITCEYLIDNRFVNTDARYECKVKETEINIKKNSGRFCQVYKAREFKE